MIKQLNNRIYKFEYWDHFPKYWNFNYHIKSKKEIIIDKLEEAEKIMLQFYEILLGESIDDNKTIDDVLFNKIPREKLIEASRTFKEWKKYCKRKT